MNIGTDLSYTHGLGRWLPPTRGAVAHWLNDLHASVMAKRH